MHTMFCLVSRQTMANVLPVLMYKPKNVVLFTTPEEKKSADNLQKLFNAKSISVKRIDGLNAYDYKNFKAIVFDELKNYQSEITLNVTGGTKLMALAAYEVFAENNKSIIYCDTEHQHIISLYPDYKIETLKADLSISDYLLSYGFEIKEKKDIKQVEKYFPLIEFINKNYLINEFVNFFKKIREKLSDDIPKITILSENKNFVFYKSFDKYTIEYNIKDRSKISIESFEFKFGDWLEYLTYYSLRNSYKPEPELLAGVKIVSQDNVENEIDVIMLKDFVLHIYSCKSGKSDNQFDLFQLETLRSITSGTYGKGYFVVSKKSTKRFLDRARELNIKVINILNNNEKFI